MILKAAFWVTNPQNTLAHNAVAGGTHFGYWYYLLDRSRDINSEYCPNKMPMGTFFNNSAHSCGQTGLWVYPSYTPKKQTYGCSYYEPPSPALFQKFTSYLNDKGAEWEQSSSVQFREFTVFDQATAGIITQTIRFAQDSNPWSYIALFNGSLGAVVADSVIVGSSDLSSGFNTPSGLEVAWDRGELIENVVFINFPNEGTQAMRAVEIPYRCT
jgi:hypothetical protein